MSYFVIDPEEQREQAETALRTAVGLLEAACDIYEKDDSEFNLKAMNAAEELVKDTKALWEEWR